MQRFVPSPIASVSYSEQTMRLIVILVGVLCVGAALAVPHIRTYDIVVSGLGNAGSTGCEYLSRNPKTKILCMEAGREIESQQNADFWGSLPAPTEPGVRFFRTEAAGLAGRDLVLANAEVAGGGSRVNGGLFQSPSERDINSLGDPLWLYDLFLQSMKELEASQDDTNSTFRGSSGPINVLTPQPSTILQDIMARLSLEFQEDIVQFANRRNVRGISAWDRNAAYEAGSKRAVGGAGDIDGDVIAELRKKYEHLTTEQKTAIIAALADIDANQQKVEEFVGSRAGDGQDQRRNVGSAAIRQDAWTKILKPVIDTRHNLHVETRSRIIKVEPTSSKKTIITYTTGDRIYRVVARKAFISSMGVIGTPYVLQHSGIGNCADIEAAGMTCVASVPELGYNFQDTLLTSMAFATVLPATGGEPGSIIGMNHATPGSNVANIEDAAIVFPDAIPVAPGVMLPLTFLQLGHIVHSNRGWIKPFSSDPHERHFIQSNMYVNAPEEKALFIDNFRRVRQLMNNATIPGTNIPIHIELAPGTARLALDASDAEIATFIDDNTSLGIHGVGTCAMGKVVDGHLRLLDDQNEQVGNIYVMDNSIFGSLLESHGTSKAAMGVGLHGAKIIEEFLDL